MMWTLLLLWSTITVAWCQRVIVAVDSTSELDSFHRVLMTLEDHNSAVTIRYLNASESSSVVPDADFQNLVLLAPQAKSLPVDLSPQRLLAHLEAGRNVFVALSSELSEFWRDFGREFDLEFEERGTAAVDHFHYDLDLDDGHHNTLVLPLSDLPAPFLSDATKAGPPILYRGVGHESSRLPLSTPVLSGLPTAFSTDLGGGEMSGADRLSGRSLGLVTGIQAKNNARITFVGSIDLLSDAFADAPVHCSDGSSYERSGNAAFVSDLLKWTFQKTGVVRASNLRHSSKMHGAKQELYRVRDDLELSVDLAKLEGGVWQPFSPPDLQFEFIMLDPHLRLPMTVSATHLNTTTMAATFRAPDRHGVFTMRVDYRRPGWSYIDEKAVVSVTPPRHDEYERFIVGALPYYGGAFSVTVAVLGFVVAWTLQ